MNDHDFDAHHRCRKCGVLRGHRLTKRGPFPIVWFVMVDADPTRPNQPPRQPYFTWSGPGWPIGKFFKVKGRSVPCDVAEQQKMWRRCVAPPHGTAKGGFAPQWFAGLT